MPELIFLPYATICTPSPRPGAGFVDPELWESTRLTSIFPWPTPQEQAGFKIILHPGRVHSLSHAGNPNRWVSSGLDR
jgi:hypothetical protein